MSEEYNIYGLRSNKPILTLPAPIYPVVQPDPWIPKENKVEAGYDDGRTSLQPIGVKTNTFPLIPVLKLTASAGFVILLGYMITRQTLPDF